MDAFLALLRVLVALNVSRSLDFSNESPCLYVKLRITFFNERCVLCHPNFNSISPSINDFKRSSRAGDTSYCFSHSRWPLHFEIHFARPVFFNLIVTVSSVFSFVSLFDVRSYELEINKLKCNSVLLNNAISFKTKLWIKLSANSISPQIVLEAYLEPKLALMIELFENILNGLLFSRHELNHRCSLGF